MKLNDVLKKLEEVAPVALSDEFCAKYKMYDNSGIIINGGAEINGALFSLDLSPKTVAQAKKSGYNLIVTHHPAIYGGISRFDLTSDPQAQALAECIKRGISVISMHLNFDAAPNGIDYYLMRGLGGEALENEEKTKILAPVTNGGYGRIYAVQPQKFSSYVKAVGAEFNTKRALAYGNSKKDIKRVASFCGAGCDDKAIAFAAANGADVFVSSDMKHHEISALVSRGINVIHLTHYSAENYGFNKIYLKIKDELNMSSAYFCDAELL